MIKRSEDEIRTFANQKAIEIVRTVRKLQSFDTYFPGQVKNKSYFPDNYSPPHRYMFSVGHYPTQERYATLNLSDIDLRVYMKLKDEERRQVSNPADKTSSTDENDLFLSKLNEVTTIIGLYEKKGWNNDYRQGYNLAKNFYSLRILTQKEYDHVLKAPVVDLIQTTYFQIIKDLKMPANTIDEKWRRWQKVRNCADKTINWASVRLEDCADVKSLRDAISEDLRSGRLDELVERYGETWWNIKNSNA